MAEEVEDRVKHLEHQLTEARVEIAGLRRDVVYIKESFDRLNENLGKVLWIIGGGFIVSIVTWIIKGGLQLP